MDDIIEVGPLGSVEGTAIYGARSATFWCGIYFVFPSLGPGPTSAVSARLTHWPLALSTVIFAVIFAI